MEIQEALINRRTIRKFKDQKVSEDNINTILRAAMYAPSSKNAKPWQFIVIDNKQTFLDIFNFIPRAEVLKQTASGILICVDSAVETNVSEYLQCGAVATQNILLSAFGLGLGSCWISIHSNPEVSAKIKDMFKLPQDIIPVSFVALGYPDEEITTDERFTKEKIHYNKW